MKTVFSLLIVAIVLMGCSHVSVDSQTKTSIVNTQSNSPSKIAFSSDRDGNSEVYIMNADGTGQTRLTNSSTFDGAPAWSSDATKIAFLSDRDGNAEIYVMNSDGSNQVNLTNTTGNDVYPDWSPDMTRIAFYTDRDGNNEIYVMNADGSSQIRLTNNEANDYGPKWSPDGSKIAFSSDREGNLDVFVMNPDGSGLVNLTNNPAHDGFPSWSGDGRKISFDSNREGNYDIHAMNADGSQPTRLTSNFVDRFAYSDWSPDGQKILISVDNGENWDIYVMDSDGKNITEMLSGPTNDVDPRWSPGSSLQVAMNRPTITPLPIEEVTIEPPQIPTYEVITVLPTSGPIDEFGWVEFFGSGTVNLGQETPTALNQLVLFHGPNSISTGFGCQGCYIIEPSLDIERKIPQEDINGSDMIFRTGEGFQYRVKGNVTDRKIEDIFLGSIPILEVTYLERIK